MKCVKCASKNVTVEMVQTGGSTSKHGTGFSGNMNNVARGFVALGTGGVSNLVWKKSTGTSKMKFKMQKTAICQSCGHDWAIR